MWKEEAMGWLKKLVGLFSAISWELPSCSGTRKRKKIETEPSEDYKNRSRSEWIYLHNRSFHIDFVYCAAVCLLCEQPSSGIMLIFRELAAATLEPPTPLAHMKYRRFMATTSCDLKFVAGSFWIFSVICVVAFQPCVFDEHSSDVHQSAAWHLTSIPSTDEQQKIQW